MDNYFREACLLNEVGATLAPIQNVLGKKRRLTNSYGKQSSDEAHLHAKEVRSSWEQAMAKDKPEGEILHSEAAGKGAKHINTSICDEGAEGVAVLKERPITYFFAALNREKLLTSKVEKVRKGQQLYFAAGKKSHVVHCPICELDFNDSVKEDRHWHWRWHRKIQEGVSWAGFKQRPVLKTLDLALKTDLENCIIVSVSSSSSKYERAKLDEVLEIVDKALGAVELSSEHKKVIKGYLFITTMTEKVVGCLVAHRISGAFNLLREDDSNSTNSGVVIRCNNNEPVDAVCGIDRIWVHSRYRRRNIATLLLQTAQDDFVYGLKLKRDQLAFSQPTCDGLRLGCNFFGRPNFPVYTNESAENQINFETGANFIKERLSP